MFSLISLAVLTPAVASLAADKTSNTSSAQINHGRYLVQRVGMCADCHTPHDEKGQPVKGRELQGSPLPFKATVPMPWAAQSPPIAGLPQFENDDQAITFFTTGKDATGRYPSPPMPAFRFNHRDAEAVVAYLRSLAKK
jgi:mono/diheme cytochrome c family protein